MSSLPLTVTRSLTVPVERYSDIDTEIEILTDKDISPDLGPEPDFRKDPESIPGHVVFVCTGRADVLQEPVWCDKLDRLGFGAPAILDAEEALDETEDVGPR